jgi:tetratricopeptide (TPR) repeat protein
MDAQGQDPVAAKAIDERILRLVDAGRPLEALACCRDAMARYPAEVILRERLCRLLLPLGWDNELYDAAIALLGEQPGNAVAHLHLAILFHRKGLSSLAIEHCNRALAQMPGLKTALHLQASALMQRGAFEEAAQLLEAIRREVPADVLFRVQLAECYLRQERSPEALALLRETVQADPDATVARAQLAQALYLAGRREEALAEFQAVRKVSPHDVLTLNNVAVISTSLGGDLDEALRCALRALELDPGNPQVIDTVGWVHFARKEYERALSMAALASTLAPDRPVILYHHAEVLAARGRDREARDALRRALALDIRFAEKERAAELLRQLDARGTAPSAQP